MGEMSPVIGELAAYGQKIVPAAVQSRCVSMVVAQETAQPLAASHGSFALVIRWPREQQDVALSLVIPLGMEMVNIVAQRPPQGALAEQDHLR